MAQSNIPLYNFYKRYLWTENDFTTFQGAQVALGKGPFEGLVGAAVMNGYGVTSSGGLTVQVAAGIAVGATGFLHVSPAANLSFSAPTGTLIARHLIVATPNIQPDQLITRPTAPFDTVPLTSLQGSQIAIIQGTPAASPAYPSKGVNDVIICGVRVQHGQSVFTPITDFDFEVREIYGVNSEFQQNASKYDNRLRPYRNSNSSVGIKPAQLGGTQTKRPHSFTYVNKQTPSIYPKSSGLFVDADSFLSMQTGVISGADSTSSAFSPTIPTSGNAIVATISITPSDTVQVNYGVIGTRAQCFNAIQNQTTGVGAGAISVPTNAKLVAFVIVYSNDGTNVTEIDVIDARGSSGLNVTSRSSVTKSIAYQLVITDDIVRMDTTSGGLTATMPAIASCVNSVFVLVNVGTNLLTIAGHGSELIAGANTYTSVDQQWFSVTLYNNGTTWDVI